MSDTYTARLRMINQVMIRCHMTGAEVVKTAFQYAEHRISKRKLAKVLNMIQEDKIVPVEVSDYCIDVLAGRAEGIPHERKKQ